MFLDDGMPTNPRMNARMKPAARNAPESKIMIAATPEKATLPMLMKEIIGRHNEGPSRTTCPLKICCNGRTLR